MSYSGSPHPVRRLEATSIIPELTIKTGAQLDFLGIATGGEVGAAQVRQPDGCESIVTMSGQPASEIMITNSALNVA